MIRRMESYEEISAIDWENPCPPELRPFALVVETMCPFAITYINCPKKALNEEDVMVAIPTLSKAPKENQNMENPVYNFKVVVIGDAAVGKTSLVKVFATGKFDTNYIPTLGVNILTKDIDFKNVKVTLVIWDLAGQGFMDTVRAQYYTGALAAIMVYDVTEWETFSGVVHWDDECKRFAPNMLSRTLVGNKVDLDSQRKVPANDGIRLAKKIGAEFFETSALSGANVETMFNNCGRNLLKNHLTFLMKKVSTLQT